MSRHRAIEWTLALLGVCGVFASSYARLDGQSASLLFGVPHSYYYLILFAVMAIFALLHVCHIVEGKKANQVVLVSCLLGIMVASASVLLNLSATLQSMPFLVSSGLFLLSGVLALILHKDFKK